MPNNFSNGLLLKYSLTKKFKSHNVLHQFISKRILQIYYKRYNAHDSSNDGKNLNIIDIMISHNKGSLEKRADVIIGETDIVGNLIAFQFAGFDTSLQASTSGLVMMAKRHPEWLEKIKADGLGDWAAIEANRSLDLAIREVLRMYSPAPGNFPRTLIKEVILDGVKVPKGAGVMVPSTFRRNNVAFKDAEQFQPERWVSDVDKLPKMTSIPFYWGKRICMGYVLAEINMKMMMGFVLKHFELTVAPDFEPIMDLIGPYQCVNPTVNMRLIKEIQKEY
jgi:cytochrome P450